MLKTDKAIESCIEGYKRILTRHLNEKNQELRSGGSDYQMTPGNYDGVNISEPIRILLIVFSNEDMDDVYSLILEDITESLIKYIFHFYNDPNLSLKNLQNLRDNADPFFEMISDYQDSVWSALGTLLRNQIQELKEEQSEFKIEAIDLIMCCLHDLFPQSLEANERRRQRQGQ